MCIAILILNEGLFNKDIKLGVFLSIYINLYFNHKYLVVSLLRVCSSLHHGHTVYYRATWWWWWWLGVLSARGSVHSTCITSTYSSPHLLVSWVLVGHRQMIYVDTCITYGYAHVLHTGMPDATLSTRCIYNRIYNVKDRLTLTINGAYRM